MCSQLLNTSPWGASRSASKTQFNLTTKEKPVNRPCSHRSSSKSLSCAWETCNIWDQQRSTLNCIAFRAFQPFTDFTFKKRHLTLKKSCGPFSVLHTILTKHQAFAPSGPMLLYTKFKFIKVEFCWRASAKTWQEKADGRRVQLLN